MSLSTQTRAMRGSTLAAVGSPPAAFSFACCTKSGRLADGTSQLSNGDTAGLPTRIRLMRRTAIGVPSDAYCNS